MRTPLLTLLAISLGLPTHTLPVPKPYSSASAIHSFNVTKSFVIALDPLLGARVAHEASLYLGLHDVSIFKAINATRAMQKVEHELPLYTQRLIQQGRNEHMQLGNAAMLGCLLSHMAIWEMLKEDDIFAVFEEDAQFDDIAAVRMRTLAADLHAHAWDMVVLETGQSLISVGTRVSVGELAETCTATSSVPCTWYGTRGYILKHSAAKLLKKHAKPFIVQVDALIGLVAAAFPATFRFYWTRADVAYPSHWRRSAVFDGCLSCIFPTVELYVYILIMLLIVNLLSMWFLPSLRRKHSAKAAVWTFPRASERC